MIAPALAAGYPYAFRNYTGDGTSVIYSVPFPYLAPSHIKVYVDGLPRTDFVFLSAGSIQLSVAPVNLLQVKVRRETPAVTSAVTFTNPSNLRADLLNTANLQLLFVAQETADQAIELYNGIGAGEYDLSFSSTGLIAPTGILGLHAVVRDMHVASGGIGSGIAAPVAGTAALNLVLKKNGTSFGTAVLASGATSAPMTITTGTPFAPGDLISLEVVAAPTGAAANFSATLRLFLGAS